ncbi:thiol-disulfide oxidoreductase DCC family protein [Paenibacillus sp. M1]|uniref:Thiol-disulfide oxidoreductase DCC family protein n=1 Tax=Paenibacillus haidiansis TaxID=1574488 RepID=A0ABU7VTJ7_9BACL
MKRTGREFPNAVVLFDGVCHLCQGAVKFIIRRDPRGRFKFASLQSEAGRRLSGEEAEPSGTPGTIVLIDRNGASYTRSTAALRIAKGLKFPWPLLYGFILVPRPIRDAVYRWIAANRYRWFGKDEACLVPTPEIRGRFLRDG